MRLTQFIVSYHESQPNKSNTKYQTCYFRCSFFYLRCPPSYKIRSNTFLVIARTISLRTLLKNNSTHKNSHTLPLRETKTHNKNTATKPEPAFGLRTRGRRLAFALIPCCGKNTNPARRARTADPFPHPNCPARRPQSSPAISSSSSPY